MTEPFTVGGTAVRRGERRTIDLPLPRLYTHTEIAMPVQVTRGRTEGPRLLLCAALHGDELNGMEIIQRVTAKVSPQRLRGVLVAVPVVNVFGFITQSRYLPDRRDLNRCFPGSASGSLGARLAHIFLTEIVGKCTHGIDLHTAAEGRVNLPQVRGDLADDDVHHCARAFGAPVIVHADTRDGSLREAAVKRGVKLFIYEGGECRRFNEDAIETGVRGVLRVMSALGMRRGGRPKKLHETVEVRKRTWVRARESGILRLSAALGDYVKRKQVLGTVSDPWDTRQRTFRAPAAGIVLGRSNSPLVHRGDAVLHLGLTDEGK